MTFQGSRVLAFDSGVPVTAITPRGALSQRTTTLASQWYHSGIAAVQYY